MTASGEAPQIVRLCARNKALWKNTTFKPLCWAQALRVLLGFRGNLHVFGLKGWCGPTLPETDLNHWTQGVQRFGLCDHSRKISTKILHLPSRLALCQSRSIKLELLSAKRTRDGRHTQLWLSLRHLSRCVVLTLDPTETAGGAIHGKIAVK